MKQLFTSNLVSTLQTMLTTFSGVYKNETGKTIHKLKGTTSWEENSFESQEPRQGSSLPHADDPRSHSSEATR